MRGMPFAAFAHNRVWLELSLIAQELLCFLRSLAGRTCPRRAQAASPVSAARRRPARAFGRRTTLRLPRSWPWADAFRAAFARLRALARRGGAVGGSPSPLNRTRVLLSASRWRTTPAEVKAVNQG
jgi:hypothetical protein